MNMWQVTAEEQGSEGWRILLYTHLGCIQMPLFSQSKSRKVCWYAWALWGQPLLFFSLRGRQQANHDSGPVGATISVNGRWKRELWRWNSTFAVRNNLYVGYCVVERREPCKESFSHVILPTSDELYTYWQCSLTASTQQAPLHLHTECVLLYLFIHFHVAKRCHFDEWEMEPANCFHSMGQV